MIHNKEKNVYELTEEELKSFVVGNEMAREYLTDIYLLRDNIMKVCAAFKLTTKDGKHIRGSILDKTENPVGSLVKGGLSVLNNMTQASIGIKSAEREIELQFGFLASLGPLLVKYGGAGEQLNLESQNVHKRLPSPK